MKIGLKPGKKGADLERLHRVLTHAGFRIDPGELEKRQFGSCTRDARDEIDESIQAVLLDIEQSITININEGAPPARLPAKDDHKATVSGQLVDSERRADGGDQGLAVFDSRARPVASR